ncbi:MAG TPA: siphovirus Gp157 family protein [Acidobacteriaceae bacterium]|nr:siphovirus Gp157 family protein [Acidobacteriaceae bacterium]
MTAPSGYKIEQVMSAWMAARARLAADPDMADDEAALYEALGPQEGDVRDILARLLRAASHSSDMHKAAKERAEAIAERADRYKRRAESLRTTAFSIMDLLGERKVELPDVTATISAGRPSVTIVDDSALPDRFIRVKREPDKSALLAALKSGEDIPGATLSNGSPSLQLRTK